MKTKTILIVSGVALALLSIAGYKKAKTLEAVFRQMRIWPSGISKIRPTLLGLNFDLKIAINNPTKEDFSLSTGGLVTLKRIIVYRGTQLLGSAVVNRSGVSIPAYQTVEIPNLTFHLATPELLSLVQLQSIDITTLSIIGVVEIFGTEYTISNAA